MQKCNFPFEMLIHDDASTDGTADIIREYETKYPDIIKPIYQTENQYSKGIGVSRIYQFPRAKGKYIALCEGDDYWTDPYKLQKQVDFLEANPEYSLLFTNRKEYYMKTNKTSVYYSSKKTYYTKDILSNIIPGTQTMVFRLKEWMCFKDLHHKYSQSVNGDRLIPYLLSLKGKIGCLPDITAVYRITELGVSTSLYKDRDKWFKHAIDDFYRFHKTLGFPCMNCYAKGQSVNLISLMKENYRHPVIFFKSSYSTLSAHKVPHFNFIYMLILCYTFARVMKGMIRKIANSL
jgi:glycosyltransferase involved in cell wall biosynthesis